MNAPLSYLESFVLLAETLNFTEVARRMRISQPCISRQIRLFEEQLGQKLFIRDRHQVRLTETGKRMNAQLSPLFREMQEVLGARSAANEALSGRVRIGSLGEFGQYTLMPMLLEFRKQHPEVRLEMQYLSDEQIVQGVRNGELDFGVTTVAPNVESVQAFDLTLEKVVVVTRARNPRKPEDEEAISLVTYRQEDPLPLKFLRRHFKNLAPRGATIQVAVNSHRSMIDALLAANAYAVMPAHSVEQAIARGQLRIVPGDELVNHLYLIHLENRLMERRSVSLRHFLVDEFRRRAKARS